MNSPHRPFPIFRSKKKGARKQKRLSVREARNRGEVQFLGFVLLALVFLLHVDAHESYQKAMLSSGLLGGVLLLLLINVFRCLPKVLSSYQQGLSRKNKNPKRWLTFQFLVSLTSSLFFLVWLFFSLPLEGGYASYSSLKRYEPFLHVGMLLALASFLMGLRRVYFIWKVFDITPGRMVFFIYGVSAFLGAVLLNMPFSLQADKTLGLVDGLFVAVSAMTLTGLSPVSVPGTFTYVGMSIIAFLIQIGGIGIIVISVSLAAIIRKRLSMSLSMLGQNELFDMLDLGSIQSFVFRVIALTMGLEIIGCFVMYIQLPVEMEHRFFHAVFHVIASFCNAGFSSFEANLNVKGLFPFKITATVLIFFANFGYLVLLDVWKWLENYPHQKRLSSDTMLTVYMSFTMYAIGIGGIFICETFSTADILPLGERIWYAVFYSVAGKTAGFNVSQVSDLTTGSLLVLSIVMVVGGASLSTAGGIKVSTAGVLMSACLSLFRGHKWIEFNRSEIPFLVLQKAVAITVVYFSVLLASIIALIIMEDLEPMDITFEMISALSTVGLSLGVTEKVGPVSKLIMVFLMLAGRLGVVSIAFVGLGKVANQRYRYAKDKFFVG